MIIKTRYKRSTQYDEHGEWWETKLEIRCCTDELIPLLRGDQLILSYQNQIYSLT